LVTTGRCRNAACSIAGGGEVLERYPGPGEYCPECGEALDPLTPPKADEGPDLPPLATLSPEAYREFQERMFEVLAPPVPTRSWRARLLLAALAALLVAAATYTVLRPAAILRRTGASPIHVCRSTITDRLAADVVRAYAAKSGTPSSRFAVENVLACDVRFAAGSAQAGDRVVAHDAIVVVVNRENPVKELTRDQLRGILTGRVSDWSQVGGSPGTIVSMAPTDGSDEAETIVKTLLHGTKLGGAVRRSRSSAEIARAVASSSGRQRIGIVAFSTAGPAKVLPIRSVPAPSSSSIAKHRYPLAVSVTVRAGTTPADPLAAGLVRYASSRAARALVERDGLIASAVRSERNGTR
jgi:hypothetical protein